MKNQNILLSFFFFQAEDGIRDTSVTGVQTCALPISVAVHDDVAEARQKAAKDFANYGVLPNYRRILDIGGAAGPAEAAIVGDEASRSEERRVGKEWRCGGKADS